MPAGPPRRTSTPASFHVRHVPVYCPPAVPSDRPDRVVFLGDLVEVPSHYQLANAQVKGRSLPCEGDGCPHCLAGHEARLCWYAPALVCQHGDDVWERVVYYVPEAAADGFGAASLRGRQFSVWRKRVGSSDRIRSRFDGRCSDLAEPWFDVWPVLNHVFHRSDESRAGLDALLWTLPPRVSPPRFRPAEPEVLSAAALAQVQEASRAEMLELLRAFKANGYRVPEPGNGRLLPGQPAIPPEIQAAVDAGGKGTMRAVLGDKGAAAVDRNREAAKQPPEGGAK
jgi:biotin operon repressor